MTEPSADPCDQTIRRALMASRVRRVERLAEDQCGVVSRRQMYAAGLSRGVLRARIRSRRWQRVGSQSIALHTGPLPTMARYWAAVFEAGPRAHLDGVSALLASGLTGLTEDRIRVSVPKGARIQRRRRPTVDIRETRRYDADVIVSGGVPRSRPSVAAIRGALWATSDRQASLIVTMTVQQGLCRAEDLARELMMIRRDRRRLMLHDLVIDLAGGIRSLGELDFVRGCRERGLPEPDAQVLRHAGDKRYYLDFRWRAWQVVVEIDGIQHGWAQNAIGDALRHNTVAAVGDIVLRLPILGLRVCPDAFFDQVAQALRNAGCPLPEKRSA